MNDTKPWYLSKTMIAGIVTLLAGLGGFTGIAISPDEQVEITELVLALATSVAGLLTLYGRKKADKKIG